ncbi:PREDICTED: leucine-rich repeat and guanylate kinase domain-containing protein-like [Priapulus caudatus]|uniref:Leucine-rich repeat and guanylate kinase domain-containing protein-like n=1 Tax=Priapulus caudatus TaxID=37621 RepID=A0ABM1F045_PRICU|nr:PREDICTED: leucine-rich repeat and guanylate kinase domain-containing protein-like [Priapulus caudatus]
MDVDDFYYKEAASSSNASGSGLQHLGHGLKEDGQIAVSVFLKLSLPGSNMSDITGLSKYSHLAQVDISFNNICDLSPLGCMKHLLFLDASHNKITKVLDFAPPHNLIQANLSYNDIEEISDLSEHPCLRKLDLSNILF